MMTTNIDKKALVDRLLKANLITAEEVYLLLDEVQSPVITMPYIQPIVYPLYPQSPTLPWYEVNNLYCGTGTITIDPSTYGCISYTA